MKMDSSHIINAHYGRAQLSNTILKSLEDAGKDIAALSLDDLAPMEEFHIGGRKATHQLATLAGISSGMRVLDIGCGIGGPARALAHYFGCRVIGIDLTKEFCFAGSMLTRRTHLASRVTIINASALDLPFMNAAFDMAWMQHAAVNIADKEKLFREIAKILRPSGKLAFYELFKGAEPIKYFPLPWAGKDSMSFLASVQEIHDILKKTGFSTDTWTDTTLDAIQFFRHALTKSAKHGPPPVSLLTLMGPNFPVMAENVLKNLEENRLSVAAAVFSFTP